MGGDCNLEFVRIQPSVYLIVGEKLIRHYLLLILILNGQNIQNHLRGRLMVPILSNFRLKMDLIRC